MLSTHSARVELFEHLWHKILLIQPDCHKGQPTETASEMSVNAPKGFMHQSSSLGGWRSAWAVGRLLLYPMCVPCYFCSILVWKLKNMLSIFYLTYILSKRASISTAAGKCWPCRLCIGAAVAVGFCTLLVAFSCLVRVSYELDSSWWLYSCKSFLWQLNCSHGECLKVCVCVYTYVHIYVYV